MIPKTLEIKGFLSYNKNVKIDFTPFDLACISGANGAGKSSILDAITWSLFGKARKSDDSIINLQSDEAIVKFTFMYEDSEYTVIRRNPIDGAKSVELMAGKVNLSERTTKMTDEKIAGIFGIDYETFINVSFFLQGKADQFTQQTPGNRKQILTQILGLDIWEEYRKAAVSRSKEMKTELARLDGRMEDITDSLDTEEDLEVSLVNIEGILNVVQGVFDNASKLLETGKGQHSSFDSLKDGLDSQYNVMKKLETKVILTKQKLEERCEDRDGCNLILKKADKIIADYEIWKDAFAKYTELEPIYEKVRDIDETRLTEIEDSAAVIIEIAQERESYNVVIKNATDQTTRDPEVVKLTQMINIHQELLDEGICPTCQTEINAENFSEELLDLKSQRDDYVKKLSAALIKEAEKRIADLDEEEKEELKATTKKADKLTAELEALNFDKAEFTTLKKIATANKDIQGHHASIITAQARLEPLAREIKELEVEVGEAEKNYELTVNQFAKDSAKADEVELNLPDIDELQKSHDEVSTQKDDLQVQIGEAKQKLKAIRESKERLGELQQERAGIVTHIESHKQLELAFGKNGIPALLIEQALPQIEDKANELLGKLSNGTMSIQFVTQREYKDETRIDKKETLDIMIQDQSGVRDYEMYSGGEAFRINFAIRLALSYVLAQRAGAKIQTLVIDEGFGSQDNMGRDRLVAAIGVVRQDFEKILIITHVDELKDVFSNQLFVEKKIEGSTVILL